MLILGFALLLTFSSCKSSFSDEIKHVDGLEITLLDNKENFDVDIELFKSRITYIERSLRTFSNDYAHTMPLELGNQLSKFKGLKKIYIKRVGQYENNIKEQSELERQITALKKDLLNASISKEEFLAYVKTESLDIDRLVISTNEVKKSLYEIESEYTRISKELEEELARITP